MERRHHAEEAGARSTRRPEEIRMVIGVGVDQFPRRCHDVDRPDALAGGSEQPAVPPVASLEEVPANRTPLQCPTGKNSPWSPRRPASSDPLAPGPTSAVIDARSMWQLSSRDTSRSIPPSRSVTAGPAVAARADTDLQGACSSVENRVHDISCVLRLDNDIGEPRGHSSVPHGGPTSLVVPVGRCRERRSHWTHLL